MPKYSNILYCIREQRAVMGSFRGCSPASILSGEANEPANLPLKWPYGLAWERSRKLLWICDKFHHRILLVKLAITNSDSAVHRVVNSVDGKAHGIVAPCMVDLDADGDALVGCFGVMAEPGGVAYFNGDSWKLVIDKMFQGGVSHCCWLPNKEFAFVSRADHRLYVVSKPGSNPQALTPSPQWSIAAAESGKLSSLGLFYVQGLRYSSHRNALLIADAGLGAIFECDIVNGTYRTVLGRATVSDSTMRAGLGSGSSKIWLGPVRAIAEDADGVIHWLDGESGSIFKESSTEEYEFVMSALPGGGKGRMLGAGMIIEPDIEIAKEQS